MTETLLDIKTLRQVSGGDSCTMTVKPEVAERLGGPGTDVVIVEDDGKIYLVPATEVSLL